MKKVHISLKLLYSMTKASQRIAHLSQSITCNNCVHFGCLDTIAATTTTKKMNYFKWRAKTNIKASVTCYVPFKLGIAVIGAF